MFVKSLYLFAAFSLAKKPPCTKGTKGNSGIPLEPAKLNYDHNGQYHNKSNDTVQQLLNMAKEIRDTADQHARDILIMANKAAKTLRARANKDANEVVTTARDMGFTNQSLQEANR